MNQGLDASLGGYARLLHALVLQAFIRPATLERRSTKLKERYEFWKKDNYWIPMFSDVFGYDEERIRKELLKVLLARL